MLSADAIQSIERISKTPNSEFVNEDDLRTQATGPDCPFTVIPESELHEDSDRYCLATHLPFRDVENIIKRKKMRLPIDPQDVSENPGTCAFFELNSHALSDYGALYPKEEQNNDYHHNALDLLKQCHEAFQEMFEQRDFAETHTGKTLEQVAQELAGVTGTEDLYDNKLPEKGIKLLSASVTRRGTIFVHGQAAPPSGIAALNVEPAPDPVDEHFFFIARDIPINYQFLVLAPANTDCALIRFKKNLNLHYSGEYKDSRLMNYTSSGGRRVKFFVTSRMINAGIPSPSNTQGESKMKK